VTDLPEIQARRAAISEAPWRVAVRSGHVQGVAWVEQPEDSEHPWRPTTIAYCHMTRGHAQSEWRNAEFIAHAPEDIDWLISRVESLERELRGRDRMLDVMGEKHGFHLE
jgi:hypothetical protein